MKHRHAIDLLTGVTGKGRHTELLTMVVGMDTTHADELVPCNAELGRIASHVLAEQALVEVIVTCGHWRMNGVEATGANQLHRLVEGQTLLDIVAQTLQVAECSMTLVAVIDIFLDTEFLQQQHTTDTEQDLLLQTVLPVAAVKGVGDALVELRVHLVVGVEQIELHTTDVDTPDIGMHIIVEIGHVNHQGITLLIQLTHNGQTAEVLGFVIGHLLPVHRQALGEVAIAIQEADGAHIDI